MHFREEQKYKYNMITVLPLLTPADTINFQVSHHPPAAAHHVTSQRGWTLWQHITIDSKFRGKYISVMPLGKKWVRNLPWCCSVYTKMYIITRYQVWILVGTFIISHIIIYKPLMFVFISYLHWRKHPPAVPFKWKPLCVEQSDFNSAQHYCGEALDWSGMPLASVFPL